MGSTVEGIEDIRQLAVVVLHAMAFVNDHVLPPDLRQNVSSFSPTRLVRKAF